MHREGLTKAELELLTTPTSRPVDASRMNKTDVVAPAAAVDAPHSSLVDLHRDFANVLAQGVSRFAQRDVAVSLREQSAGTYGQFVLAQLVPTCCAVVRSKAVDLEFWLSIQPGILYPILDRMLGSRQSDPTPQRPLTEIESGLAMIILNEIISEYGEAWQKALSLELRVERIVHNAQQLGALTGGEPTWRVRYGIQCAQDFGQLEICLPWASTRQIRERLAANQDVTCR